MPRRLPPARVPLERALSKLGLASRARAREWILAGRLSVDGRACRDPHAPVVPERLRLLLDGKPLAAVPRRVLLFHKPRGIVTSRRDEKGRPTVFSLLGDADEPGLHAVGRLDLASSGLLLLTNDTRLSAWLCDPAHGVLRSYSVTVRGRLAPESAAALVAGIAERGERLRARAVEVRKASGRETHLLVELDEGKNREIRRLLAALGHEVVRLRRLAFGGLELGELAPGAWREPSEAELRAAFPGLPLRRRLGARRRRSR